MRRCVTFRHAFLLVLAALWMTPALAADTLAPTTPATLNASPISISQMNLNWTVSTDNIAVTAYLLERCKGAGCTNFAQIASVTSPTLTYNDASLTVATSYSYRVRARDAANNKSGYSPVVSASTLADTQAPTIPSGVTVNVLSDTQLSLSWNASTDNLKTTGYLIERCVGVGCSTFTQIATTTTAVTYTNTALTPATSYSYRLRAKDAAANLSDYSIVVTANTLADIQAPTVPTGLTATAASTTKITLAWTASTDDVKVTGYKIERCLGSACSNFVQIATSTGASYSNTGLTSGTPYTYRVRATDATGNLSDYSNTATTTTTGTDTQAPTVPAGLSATPTASQVTLTWIASTDNVGVAGYEVDRCTGSTCTTFASIATPTSNTFNDTSVAASATYRYRVRAKDAIPNWSAFTGIVNVTTPVAGDTTPPSVPTNLTATATSTAQINLTWNASTDNVGVTAYLLERCQGASCSTFAQIASPTTTSYSDMSLTPATSYTYRVRATDAANNGSAYSATTTATTQSTGPITFTYSYDSLGRITHAAGSNGTSIDYQYDDNGNVTRIDRQ